MSQNPSTFLDGLLTVQTENARPQNDSAAGTFAIPPRRVLNLNGLAATDNPTAVNADGSVGRIDINVGGGDQGTIVPPPKATNWTHYNFGAGTTLVDSGSVGFPTIYLSDFSTGGGNLLRAGTLPLTSIPYTLTARFRFLVYPANNAGVGIVCSDGTKFIAFSMTFINGGFGCAGVPWTNTTTPGSAYFSTAVTGMSQNAPVWFTLKNDGTHRTFTYGSDGVNVVPTSIGGASTFPLSQASGTFLTETQLGIEINPQGGTGSGITLESWILTYP